MSSDKRDRAAYNWAEEKEQATRREWSAFGDVRVQAFKAGADWATKEHEALSDSQGVQSAIALASKGLPTAPAAKMALLEELLADTYEDELGVIRAKEPLLTREEVLRLLKLTPEE